MRCVSIQADLRRADFRAKQRAMEDALMALEVRFDLIGLYLKSCICDEECNLFYICMRLLVVCSL